MNLKVAYIALQAIVLVIFGIGSLINIVRSIAIGDSICTTFFALTLIIDTLLAAILVNENRRGGVL